MSSVIDEEEHRAASSDAEGNADDLQQEEPFDSSEEEEDDDEEEMQKIRDGFIVDDEDDDTREKRKKKHKRRHAERKDDEDLLDEDDLELVMENSGAASAAKEKSKFKRLKKAPVEEPKKRTTDLNDFFSDDEEEEEIDESLESSKKSQKSSGRTVIDELDDFIEDDEFSDLDEEAREEARRRRKEERLKPTELSGIDSEKVDELYDIFGDGEDYAWALEDEDEDAEFREDESRPQLKDIYEPEELKARMLTSTDKVIRDTDIPERFQELRKPIKNYTLSPEDFAVEQQWVAYQLSTELLHKRTSNFDEAAFNKAVADVLTFISKNNLEVPFIYSHRRDYLLKTTIYGEGDDAHTDVETLLTEDDLWRIVQLDIEYHALLEKKNQVMNLIVSLQIEDSDFSVTEAFGEARSITDLQDIYDHLNFEYSAQLKDLGLKRAKTSIHDKIRNDRLYELVNAIGISASDFAENIVANSKLHITTDHQSTPLALAESICEDETSLYAKSSQAIEASKHFFAEQFYNNLKVRKFFRDLYQSYANFSVVLTESGRLKIDKNSSYADFKYAINRSADEFYEKPDFFLRMLEAEAAHLIVIKVEPISYDQLFENLYNLIASDGQSDVAAEWNVFRRSALEIATKKLFPVIALNIKETLRRDCERLLFFQVRAEFLKKIDQAPYQSRREGAVPGSAPRVFAVSPGNGAYGQDSIIGAFLNESGEVVETYKFDENAMIPRDRLAEGELSFDVAFSDAIKDADPDVIVINGFNVKTHKLYTKIKEIVDYFQLQVDGQMIDVIYVNDEVAVRYQNSKRAKEEFPSKSSLVRYTIALARYAQSPLLEYVTLGDDITTLSFHKYQYLLSDDTLRQAINTALVDIVNMVGVDINACVTSSYLASLLPYISGLGERKASGLLKAVQQHPLFSRQALITNQNIKIGTTIFLNCASFLRIPQNRSDAVNSGGEVEAVTLLDDTRIHPEDYALAEKMAADALDLDEEQIEELRDAPVGDTVIDKLLDQGVGLLQSLILEDYSRQLEESFGKKKRATLQMILEELQEPFAEIRRKFHILQSSEIFETLTGDSPDNFYAGMVVPVSIRRVNRYQVNAQTSNLIECVALPSEYDPVPFPDKYQVGQSAQAKLLSVNYDAFTAEISLAEYDVKHPVVKATFEKPANKWDVHREMYDTESELRQTVQSQKKTRIINHPFFQNLNAGQAQNYLAPKPRGSCVIRPSSKGNDHITITWKVDNNLYQHIDVVEHEKENEFSLGKRLTIGSESFTDLDEIVERYIGGIVHNLNQMLNHDKFRAGSQEEVSKWLDNFSKANPGKGAYAFCLNHKRPGYISLLFKTSATSQVFNWSVRVVPQGFILLDYPYPDMTLLCNGFKTVIKTKAQGPQAPKQRYQSHGASYPNRTQGQYNNGGNGYDYSRSYQSGNVNY